SAEPPAAGGASMTPRTRAQTSWCSWPCLHATAEHRHPAVMTRVSGRSGRRLRLDDERDDHRAAAQLLVDPAADRAAHDLRQRVVVAYAVACGLLERRDDLGHHIVEDPVVLGDTACVDLRSGDHATRARVDDDDHGDEALLAEDASVLQIGVCDSADGGAVDVDEADVELARHPRLAVAQVDDRAVGGDEGALLGDAG